MIRKGNGILLFGKGKQYSNVAKESEGAKATDQKDKSIEQGKMNPIKTSKDKDR